MDEADIDLTAFLGVKLKKIVVSFQNEYEKSTFTEECAAR